MPERDTIAVVAEEIAKALMPLRDAIQSTERFSSFMAGLGWDVEDIPPPVRELGGGLNTIANELQNIISGSVSPSTIENLRTAINQVVNGIDAISRAPESAIPERLRRENFALEFPQQLIEYLLVEYLVRNQPQVGFVLGALGVIRIEYHAPRGNRRPYMTRRLDFNAIPRVFEDPVIIFENAFGWRTDDFNAGLVFRYLEDLLITLGVYVYIQKPSERAVNALEEGASVPGNPVRRALIVSLFEQKTEAGLVGAGLGLYALPKHGTKKPGLALLPYTRGALGQRFTILPNLFLTINAGFNLEGGVGLKLRPDEPIEVVLGFENDDSGTSLEGMLTIRLDYGNPGGTPTVLFGSRNGSRMELKTVSGVGGLYLDARDRRDLYFELELQEAKLFVVPGEGDGFLQRILPRDGFGARFDLAVGWSSERGFYFRGSSALQIRIPSHFRIGPIEMQSVTLSVAPEGGAVPVQMGASIRAELGPLTATVLNLGLTARFAFPGHGGNLGPLQLTLDLKPPDGIGLAIDGGGFRGGGSLQFDTTNQAYSGILQISFQNTINLTAIGLLNTRLPDGQPGFSLLIIISAEFTPLQLGMGFTLNGVGGLIGINRAMRIEPLREGIRGNTLDHILFPRNPVANADRIISDLRQIFPPAEGRFVFGPMAKLGWGTPTLITLELGLMIEVPSPVRIAILGVLKILLPDDRLRLLLVQVNFLGVIDFERKQLAFDASLFESRLLFITLSGDMAVRLIWGDEPNFLLSVGGFHPDFTPPPLDLPALRRITMNLLGGNNPRLVLELYFAVTSNTVQVGARVELFAEAGPFNVYGFLGFDVLFQFSPFYFVAQISAGLTVRAGTTVLLSIFLSFRLEGPTPWRARGTARFQIIFTFEVSFNKTFGEERDTALPPVSVLPLLTEALRNRNNWQAELPANYHDLVNIKDLSSITDTLLVHPFGALTVSQKIVPLDLTITKFGNSRPADASLFRISEVSSNGRPLETSEVREQFAPAQFLSMSDDDRLARKSFEKLKSGFRIRSVEEVTSSQVVRRNVAYERRLIDRAGLRRLLASIWESATTFSALLLNNAAGRSSLSATVTTISPLAPERVDVAQEGFAVVNVSDLALIHPGATVMSQTEAQNIMSEMIAADPALAGAIQVVPTYEVNGL
jgi:hypothetical protein